MIITVNGQKYDIVNWEEFAEKLLYGIGIQVQNEIIKNINDMKLVDTGDFKTSILFEVNNGNLVVYSTAKHAPYLEYGTYAYFDRFGLQRFPANPDPKKKDLPLERRDDYPKGMQPFANFRRVFYNPTKMSAIIDKGAKVAARSQF